MLENPIHLQSTYDLYRLSLPEVEKIIKKSNKEALEMAYLQLLEEARNTDRFYGDALRMLHKVLHTKNIMLSEIIL
jgi:hypothetical protein